MSEQTTAGEMNVAREILDAEYDQGWYDGYVEGYACKLIDVGQPFSPTDTTAGIEAAASWLLKHYATCFSKSAAIGAARAMLRAARGDVT